MCIGVRCVSNEVRMDLRVIDEGSEERSLVQKAE